MKSKIIIGVLVSVAIIGSVFYVINNNSKTNTPHEKNSAINEPEPHKNTQKSSASNPKMKTQTVGQQADCSTYNFTELTEVWGVPFVDTDINKVTALNSSGGKLYSCSYNQTDSGQGVTYTIEYREHTSEDQAKQDMNDVRSTEKYGDTKYYTKEDKVGVGDEAFFWAKNRTDGSKEVNQQMYIRKGSVVFLLSGVNLDGVDASYKDKLVASYKLHFE
jgi:hypothetical protein